MKTNRKILLLGLLCMAALLCLSGIQYYLINTTYNYKKQQFKKKIQKDVNSILDRNATLDSLQHLSLFKILKHSEHYLLLKDSMLKKEPDHSPELLYDFYKKLDQEKEKVQKALEEPNKKINDLYSKILNKKLKEKGIPYEVEIGVLLNDLLVFYTSIPSDSVQVDRLKIYQRMRQFYKTNQLDTLLSAKDDEGIWVLGQKLDEEKAIMVSSGTNKSRNWERNDEMEIRSRAYSSEVINGSKTYINIPGWERMVLREMLGLLALAIGSILVVMLLFWLTFRTAMRQKKIADMKTDFINNVTHELKTPLATLSLATQSIRSDVVLAQPEKVREIAEVIERQNQRLQKLVDQVLHNSISADALKLEKNPIIIEDFLQKIVYDYRLSVEGKPVEIQVETSNKNTILNIDKFYLFTAVKNILDNAVKYNPKQVAIHVKGYSNGNDYTIEIQDDGIGIPKKEHKNVFEKFYRISTGDRHDTQGLGLGLHLVQQIVLAHGGKAGLQSNQKGGCNFIIHIPKNTK